MSLSLLPRAEARRPRDAAGAWPPIPLLFLVADTGGGHRSAARAVADALVRAYPGRFAPVLLDPLTGPRAPWPLRRVTGLYGPLIRRAPRAWGILYRLTDSGRVARVLARTVLRLAERPVAEAVAALRPAALVSFHPLATSAAMSVAAVPGAAVPGAAVPGAPRRVPVVTVVTDLVSAHSAWRYGPADRIVVPSAQVALGCRRDGIGADRCLDLGLPVAPQFRGGPTAPSERAGLRRHLGLGARSFVVVVTGGGEGAGGLARRVSALLGAFADGGTDGTSGTGLGVAGGAGGVEVVALCGRNRRLQRRLGRLQGRRPASGARLTVRGFVGNMAEWLRCADVVVTKAGPGTIAEAACCGTPLIITSRLPGQEDGNAEFVVGAGAGRYAPRPEDAAREAARLRRDPGALAAMRAASARLGRPEAAASVAALLAGLAHAAGDHGGGGQGGAGLGARPWAAVPGRREASCARA